MKFSFSPQIGVLSEIPPGHDKVVRLPGTEYLTLTLSYHPMTDSNNISFLQLRKCWERCHTNSLRTKRICVLYNFWQIIISNTCKTIQIVLIDVCAHMNSCEGMGFFRPQQMTCYCRCHKSWFFSFLHQACSFT